MLACIAKTKGHAGTDFFFARPGTLRLPTTLNEGGRGPADQQERDGPTDFFFAHPGPPVQGDGPDECCRGSGPPGLAGDFSHTRDLPSMVMGLINAVVDVGDLAGMTGSGIEAG